ncbi:related to glycerophosphoryl diester phosphodiesterase family protein [Rhynchosporium graminicola]|uniref:glycerophosphodiester phosphodiesterase n=1 Tax=Rhynchosporium graminicola TaxID=2792576 RepID=A0A1E1LJ85_9HELO|nr:related to glycerophosphoryl diester phosphodiesterase family protein [Rhynchosporium commune]
MHASVILYLLVVGFASAAPAEVDVARKHHDRDFQVQVGDRPYFLIDNMDDGPLKRKLESCKDQTSEISKFAIGHRGAPLMYPEHTVESYNAAARQGAGTIECDVAFTKDKKLVCRHDHCDLHTTTNILTFPDLAAKCTTPFKPYDPVTGAPAFVKCCTTDITLKEFKSLCGKMDGFNPNGTSVASYMDGTPPYRTDLYSTCGTLLTHKESIKLIDSYGRDFTPECKTPGVKMPFNGWTQEDFAQEILDEYKQAGIHHSRVWPQSFLPADVFYWIKAEPKFGRQAVYLDERVDTPEGYANATASLPALAKAGVKIMAPAFFAMTKLDKNNKIVPSEYAIAAKKAGMDLIGWSFERSGFLKSGGGYYYGYVNKVINNDGDMYTVLDVLVKDVKILKMFSDWPATVVYYANCMGLP